MKWIRVAQTTNTMRISIQVPGCFLKSAKPSAIHSHPRPASTLRGVDERAGAADGMTAGVGRGGGEPGG